MTSLADRRVLVVGASRGIGLAVAGACVHAGAKVTLAARTGDKVRAAAAELGANAFAVECDATDPDSCVVAVDGAVQAMGGLDALIYAAGVGAFGGVAELTRDAWTSVFETNVFGAHAITVAALPSLVASQGQAVYLNSESSEYMPAPWRGIAGYIASKRALNSMVRSFQTEHPDVSFLDYIVGATATDFGDGAAFEWAGEWAAHRYIDVNHVLVPDDHGATIVVLLSLPRHIALDHISVRSRRGPLAPPAPFV